jgi:glycosyltransferase involved in cell wall biosynthesis
VARVGIDATSVAPGGKGIARVQERLVHALATHGRHDVVAFARTPAAAAELAPVATHVIGDGLALAWEQVGMRRALREVDVLLTLTDRLPVGAQKRIVVWLFEPPTHRIAENRRRRAGAYQQASDLLTTLLWRHSVDRAGRLVAASQSTARELGRELPVVYPGLDERFQPGPGREGRYFFHLGSSDPRDDSETVLAAFARVDTAVDLLVAGGLGDRADEMRALAGPRVRFLGRVSDEELVELYRGAIAYLDASLYEGFGLQVAEAMACGAPVIAADTTSIPEVVGDAGILCGARDVAAFAAAMQRVLDEPGLAARLREQGVARAARFTWDRTAEQFAAILDEMP